MVKKPKPEQNKPTSEHDDDFILKATVIGVDPGMQPIKATVVGDNRNKFGRRLGIFAIVILVLFFMINNYIQSSKNGRDLKSAKKDRASLIHAVDGLAQTIKDQDTQIRTLQNALREQNKLLAKAGFKTVRVPGESSTSAPTNISPSGQPQSSSSHSSHPSSKPSSSPSSKPSSQPSQPPPRPDPTQSVKDTVCSLTGICLQTKETNDFQQQAVRPAQVYSASTLASPWYVVLRLVTDLGIARWW